MDNDLKIFCKNTQEYIDIDGGDTLQQIYETIEKRIPFRPICALVNNKLEALNYPVYGPKMVEYIEPVSPQGIRVYIHSLCMILYKAIEDLSLASDCASSTVSQVVSTVPSSTTRSFSRPRISSASSCACTRLSKRISNS